MFGFKKRNKSKPEAKAEQITNTEVKTNKSLYTPVFGTLEDFLASNKGADGSLFGNNITVINDDKFSVAHQCIMPAILKGNLSYVVFDPDGKYYDEMRDRLVSIGYDVQQVDFDDELNRARVDIFEAVNITRNSYWLAFILAGSIKCDSKEIPVAHSMFVAIMQYLLSSRQSVTIKGVKEVFDSIKSGNTVIINDLASCPESKSSFTKFTEATKEVRESVMKKAAMYFLHTAIRKAHNPNVFAMTTHKKL